MLNLNLTKKEVEVLVLPHRFKEKERRTWEALSVAIDNLPEEIKTRLAEASNAKLASSNGHASRKRQKHFDDLGERHKKRRRVYKGTGSDEFMQPPTVEDIQSCFHMYRHATSNEALRREICVVCGRKLMGYEGVIQRLNTIPNQHHLQPTVPHLAHQLSNGLLLEAAGIRYDEGSNTVGFFCNDCHNALRENKLPPYSLANDLWIGPVPFELRHLTISEQLLIARHHPRCFIFKLFSHRSRQGDPNKLQLGIRGNVTVYELPTEGVVQMVEGQLLPSSCETLASVISVTFVGSRKLPRNWLKETFRVRRKLVAKALEWLKANNALYNDINIDPVAINDLPEDGVPDEISELALHDRSDFTAAKEAEGYAGDSLMDESVTRRVHDTAYDDGSDTVIPLHYNGVTDTNAMKIPQSELMETAMQNCEADEPGYAVRYSHRPISTFGETKAGYDPPPRNPLMAAYPLLWPYGVGGIEEIDHPGRRVRVSFNSHVRWCLQYHDERFALHHSFPFVAFGIEQRREALRSAKMQMRRTDFERDLAAVNSVTLAELRDAERAEEQGKKIDNAKVCKLRKHVFATSGRVMGSNNCRASYRSEIWGTCLRLGPPSIWVTINPADVHDPVMQVLAGESIDMDKFIATAGPDKDQRARNVAKNPFAAAHYFNFIIKTMLECLFRVKKTKYRVESGKGIFGRISGYHGLIEAQGRGSLHLHIFFWFHGTPNASEIEECLRSEEFRQKVASFLASSMRADVEGMDDAALKAMTKENDLAYARPPDPEKAQWKQQFSAIEKKLVRSVQYHECNSSCLTMWKSRWVCKRGAPWPLSKADSISEGGVVHIRRLCGFVCTYSPSILVCMGCNNNVQLLIGGKQTKDAMWYLTDYTTKKQKKGFNTSALLANALLFHQKDTAYLDDLRERNRLLVFRCSNTLNCQMELSGQQVMSYLMGWGDAVRSHHYVPVCWAPLGQYLRLHIPDFRTEESEPLQSNEELNVTLTVDRFGKFGSRSAIADYVYRPRCFQNMGFLDYSVNTYKVPLSSKQEQRLNVESDKRRGRHCHTRGKYLKDHMKSETYIRVLRDEHHNSLPSIIGPWFPRPDGENNDYDYYCASMLSILRPWRNLEDLKQPSQTWHEALQDLIRTDVADVEEKRATSFNVSNVLSAVAFFYDSKSMAATRREEGLTGNERGPSDGNNHEEEVENEEGDAEDHHAVSDYETMESFGRGIDWNAQTEADLQAYQLSLIPHRELAHALEAIHIAKTQNILDRRVKWSVATTRIGRASSKSDNDLAQWTLQMQGEIDKINDEARLLTNEVASSGADDGGDVDVMTLCVRDDEGIGEVQTLGSLLDEPLTDPQGALPGLDVSHLNREQSRAYDIVSAHLQATLNGRNPGQLLMIIYGEGGTGKSRVIQSITEDFERRGVAPMLCKGAFTGVAASLIDGKTLHVLAGIPLRGDRVAAHKRRQLEQFWATKSYMIIDEISMVSRELFAKISRSIGFAVAGSGSDLPFGGRNVILAGDFHQFPPVVSKPTAPLYYPINSKKDSIDDSLGRQIYEAFHTVVILREQKRITDPIWHDILRHARHGSCTAEHLQILRSLVLSNQSTEKIDFSRPPWSNVTLLTPRHHVRIQWNQVAAEQHCRKTNQVLFICPANDVIYGKEATIRQRFFIAKSTGRGKPGEHGRLQDFVQLAIGLKVMVTWNIQTDIDLANGSQGIITDIVLDENEPRFDPSSHIVYLKTVPKYILVKLARCKLPPIGNLPQGIVPITPLKRSYSFPIESNKRITVQRTQLPITLAYAMTDIRGQGQTLAPLIADIGKVPSGGQLTAFNGYVALSRAPARDSIRLLRDFDDKLFTQHPSQHLREEDNRLQKLDSVTTHQYHAAN